MSDWVVKVTSPKGKLLLTGTYDRRDGTFNAKGVGYGAYGLRSVQDLAQKVGVVKSDAPRAHVEWRLDAIEDVTDTTRGLPLIEELKAIVRDPWGSPGWTKVGGVERGVPLRSDPDAWWAKKNPDALEGRTAVPIKLLPNPRTRRETGTTRATKQPRLDLSISRKVNPSALRTSSKMYALLGYLLERSWTSPEIRDLSLTSDGYVMATTSDGARGQFFGTNSDLVGNLHGLADEGVITKAEAKYLMGRYIAKSH